MTDEKIDSRLCSVCNGTGLNKNVPCGFCGAKGSVPSWVAEAYERNHKGSNRITQKDEPMTDEEAIKQLKSQLFGNDNIIPSNAEELDKFFDKVARRAQELGARPTQEFPQEGDEYWHLDGAGWVNNSRWHPDKVGNAHLHKGNVFASQEAAEREARRREVRTKIAAIDAECAQSSYEIHIFFKKGRGEFQTAPGQPELGGVYVHSKEAAERVLSELQLPEDLDLLTMEPEFVPPKLGK